MDANTKELKREILDKVSSYSKLVHNSFLPGFDPKRDQSKLDQIPYAGRTFDDKEVVAAVESCLDFWLTLGKNGVTFESRLSQYLGVKSSILVNSGSSANLLAVSALTSHKIDESQRLFQGDEVITCAAGFPTTVAPIIQNGAIPVFIDNDPLTGNPKVEQLNDAYSKGKTKAIIFAHTLGNPFDLTTVLEFAHKHKLWLIEDNCDALGANYCVPMDRAQNCNIGHLIAIAEKKSNDRIQKVVINGKEYLKAPTGSFGDLSTQSFYPPHHITLGEGGCVNIVNNIKLKLIVESFRDWGRDCWCPSGVDNSCNKRFKWQLGDLPKGYDHKFTYSHAGYNLKPLDIQAAIGIQQLEKLDSFVDARNSNWALLRTGLDSLKDKISFSRPTHWDSDSTADENNPSSGVAEPSWFGFMILLKEKYEHLKPDFANYLQTKGIGNRMLFGGNLVRQPFLVKLKSEDVKKFRTPVPLSGADILMKQAIFVGVFPGLTKAMINRMISDIRYFFEKEK